MKKLFLFLSVIGLTFQSCSSGDDNVDDPITAVCDTPINLSISEITEASAVLNWDNPNNDLDVNVEYGPTGFSLGNGIVRSTSQNSISIDGLNPDTSYDFYVQAICAVDNTSTQSNVSSFTTNECQIPINLSVSEIKADSTVLNWENLNVGQDVNVEYGPAGFILGNGTVISASENSISIDGLIPDTSYDFYVQAVCSVNNMQSEVGTFTTNTPSPFAGTWSGTYDGDDSGTWVIVYSINGDFVSGSSFSNNAQQTFIIISATTNADGSGTSVSENGTIATTQTTGNTITGTWVNASAGNISGTLSGSKE